MKIAWTSLNQKERTTCLVAYLVPSLFCLAWLGPSCLARHNIGGLVFFCTVPGIIFAFAALLKQVAYDVTPFDKFVMWIVILLLAIFPLFLMAVTLLICGFPMSYRC
jgi:hypothetical protein